MSPRHDDWYSDRRLLITGNVAVIECAGSDGSVSATRTIGDRPYNWRLATCH
ncbi:hypothetical protein [Ruminococcus sp.]|uniref:hypothetical protein n=1 Tax=Ruminococcus sp. TaxID=41978 RepID=UPI003890921B